MKKLSYIILGFIIGAVLTYYFCPRQIDMEVDTKIVNPKGVISIKQAKVLNKNWTDFRKAAVDSAAKQQGRNQDDRWVSWSLEDINDYLAYAKHYSDSIKYDMTGIRVYLGVYGKNAGQTKKDLTTMFIVPTGKKAKSQASSLNLFLPPGNGTIPVPPLNEGNGGPDDYED
tara:strand:- start:4409 stop:4921 length:513 start_codon:yes stop_codon:yes gene_type:complete